MSRTTTNTTAPSGSDFVEEMGRIMELARKYRVIDTAAKSSCLHDKCPDCNGTGSGPRGMCVHMISCPCPKCTPSCMV
jgi:hypothetical protein